MSLSKSGSLSMSLSMSKSLLMSLSLSLSKRSKRLTLSRVASVSASGKDGEKIPAGSLLSYYRLRRANYMLKDDGAAYLRCYEAMRGARAGRLVRGKL